MREINLLPPSRRQAMRRRAAEAALVGLLSAAAISVGIITALGVVSWVTIWMISSSRTPTTSTELNAAVSEYKELRQTIAERNNAINEINKIGDNRIRWSEMMSLLLASVPANTTIRDLRAAIARDEDNLARATITINGQTSNRATLTLFEGRLQQLPGVRSVQSPPSNLLERVNPPYQFTIVLDPPQL